MEQVLTEEVRAVISSIQEPVKQRVYENPKNLPVPMVTAGFRKMPSDRQTGDQGTGYPD